MLTTRQVGALGSRASARRHANRRLGRGEFLFVLPAILFVSIAVLYPLAYNIGLSFFNVGPAEISGLRPAAWVGVSNYVAQFTNPDFWMALLVSIVYATLTVVVALVVGMAFAVFFNSGFVGATKMRALLLLAWVLPTVVSANVWRWLLDGSYGLVNAVLQALGLLHGEFYWLSQSNTALGALILATAWSLAPFAMILLTAGLQSVPTSLYEAARMDGASRFQQFKSVTIPILRPVTLTTALLCFIYTFVTFDMIFLMTAGGPGNSTKALTVYAYQEAFHYFRFGSGAVGTTVLLIVPVVLAVLYFRSVRREELS